MSIKYFNVDGRKTLLALVAVSAATALLLRSEGRLWICSCGQILIWSGNVCSSDNSQHFLDQYSFTHLLHGFVYCWLLAWVAPRLLPIRRFWLALCIESLWEVIENSDFIIQRYRETTAALGYQGDTVVNSLGDILSCAAGFMIARQLGPRRSLALFVVIEVVLVIWIRDSLILEVLMLIYPINAIKAWQMCH
jgi:hypothetical protein